MNNDKDIAAAKEKYKEIKGRMEGKKVDYHELEKQALEIFEGELDFGDADGEGSKDSN